MSNLKSATDQSLTAEEMAAVMDKMLEDEETTLHTLEQELKRLRDMQYKRAQVGGAV